MTSEFRRTWTPVVLIAATVAVAVGAGLAIGPGRDLVASMLTPGASAPASASPLPSESMSPDLTSAPPTATPPAATPASTANPATTTAPQTAVPDPSDPEAWTAVLNVSAPGTTQSVTHIEHLPGVAFVAVLEVIGTDQPPPVCCVPRHSEIYLSADGSEWRPADTGDVFDDGLIRSLVVADGRFVASGWTGALSGGYAGTIEEAMWVSDDGERWTAVESPVAGGTIVAGPAGIVAVYQDVYDSDDVLSIYYSANATDWQLVHSIIDDRFVRELAAGDEGFVYLSALRSLPTDEPEILILASGDGRAWYEAPPEVLNPSYSELAPLGGDWVAVGGQNDVNATGDFLISSTSANGLDWAESGQISDPLARESFGIPSQLESAGGHLFLSIEHYVGERIVSHPMGVWHSTDGVSWEMLPLGDDAEVSTAHDAGCCLLIGGRTGHGGSPATIWRLGP